MHERGKTCPCRQFDSTRRAGNRPTGSASNSRRIVDTWLPNHGWELATVWMHIAAAGTRVHDTYEARFARSCVFGIYSPRAGTDSGRPPLSGTYVFARTKDKHASISFSMLLASSRFGIAPARCIYRFRLSTMAFLKSLCCLGVSTLCFSSSIR